MNIENTEFRRVGDKGLKKNGGFRDRLEVDVDIIGDSTKNGGHDHRQSYPLSDF